MRTPFGRRAVGLAVLLVCVVTSAAHAGSDQGWITNSITWDFSNRVFMVFGQGLRYMDPVFAGPAFLGNLVAGLSYRTTSNTYIGLGYKRQDTIISEDLTLFENRGVLETALKMKLIRKLGFDVRFRLEYREFEQVSEIDNWRYRFRFRFKIPFSIGKVSFEPYIAEETFGDSLDSSPDIFDRGRFYLGTYIPVHKSVKFQAGYIRQDTVGKGHFDVVNLGVQLHF